MGRLTESEFAAIARQAAVDAWKVDSVAVDGYTVRVTVESGSGKSTFEAVLEFDPDTGHCAIRSPYAAKAPKFYADAVQEALRNR